MRYQLTGNISPLMNRDALLIALNGHFDQVDDILFTEPSGCDVTVLGSLPKNTLLPFSVILPGNDYDGALTVNILRPNTYTFMPEDPDPLGVTSELERSFSELSLSYSGPLPPLPPRRRKKQPIVTPQKKGTSQSSTILYNIECVVLLILLLSLCFHGAQVTSRHKKAIATAHSRVHQATSKFIISRHKSAQATHVVASAAVDAKLAAEAVDMDAAELALSQNELDNGKIIVGANSKVHLASIKLVASSRKSAQATSVVVSSAAGAKLAAEAVDADAGELASSRNELDKLLDVGGSRWLQMKLLGLAEELKGRGVTAS